MSGLTGRTAFGEGPRGVLVTGTDTGVGKTVVCGLLAAVWTAAGRGVTYVKPAQSGLADGDDDARDVVVLAPTVRVVTGHVFAESLAPAVAARRAGRELTGDELAAVAVAASAAAPADDVVVEGAGGLLVELGTDGATVADLAGALGLPVLVVARPGLGTLNHAALTLEVARTRGLAVAGVVVSGYSDDPDLATRTNLAELTTIATRYDTVLAGVVPRLAALDRDTPAGAASWFTAAVGGTGPGALGGERVGS